MADLTFTGGEYGICKSAYASVDIHTNPVEDGGSQQFTADRLSFSGCKTAVRLIWDWGWLWKNAKVDSCDTGFEFLPEKKTNESASKENGNIGSAAFMESVFNNVKQAIVIHKPDKKPGTGTTGLVLNKVLFSKVDKAVADTDGNTILEGNQDVDNWILGPVYQGSKRSWSAGTKMDPAEPSRQVLDGDSYLERQKPQYRDESASNFIHLKDYAKGTCHDCAASRRRILTRHFALFR